MSYLFIPPVVEEGPIGGHWLFQRYRRKQGVTVMIIDGDVYEDMFPVEDMLREAEHIFLGGHEYIVDEADKELLESYGYEVFDL